MRWILPVALCSLSSLQAASLILNPTEELAVSDATTTTTLGTVNGGVASDYPVRGRGSITQNTNQVVSFVQYDLSSVPTSWFTHPEFEAEFVIDMVGQVNAINNMAVILGRTTMGT